MSAEYDHGRRDGLRLALAIITAQEEKWSALLGESRSARTNAIRGTRHKTLQIAKARVATALRRMTPKGRDAGDHELTLVLEKLGL